VVVAGDFNALWGKRELDLFLSATGLVTANQKGTASWPSRAPMLELDYIFHSPYIRTRRLVIPQIKLSDHAPLVWDFILPKHPRKPDYETVLTSSTQKLETAPTWPS
jgi:endonuclease/exonuclease/phosphatase family metal-dependent hydrolase